MLRVGTILHPTDYSDQSKNALNIACALTRDYGSRLVLLHVAMMPFTDRYEIASPESVQKYETEQLNKLELPIHTVRAERRCVVGDPASEILRVAKEIQADMIVLGTHGRTGVKRLLMGSVAEQVLRKAPCMVLTITSQESFVESDKQ
jgi:nucleotide-binding universal stress UspA family protein